MTWATARTTTADLDLAPDAVLEVRDLKTHFPSRRGVAKAVDGVSFTLPRGRTVAVVGGIRFGQVGDQLVDHGAARAAGPHRRGSDPPPRSPRPGCAT